MVDFGVPEWKTFLIAPVRHVRQKIIGRKRSSNGGFPIGQEGPWFPSPGLCKLAQGDSNFG
jgi:hypothetical protein